LLNPIYPHSGRSGVPLDEVRHDPATERTYHCLVPDDHEIGRQFELNIHVLSPQTLIDGGHTEETLATYRMIHGEDIPICDSVWQGLQSTQYTPGRLSHLEGCIWYFHEYLQRKLSAV
jgi:hypothetical protein